MITCLHTDRQNDLLSLNHRWPSTCLDDDESLLPVRESVTQMVFQTAKGVLGLTSYVGIYNALSFPSI